MTYFNNLGQGRVGWRSPSAAVAASTLSTSIYAVWNAETLGTSLSTSLFGVWNGEVLGTSLDTNLHSVWDGASALPSTNYSTITNSMTHLWKGEGNNTDSIGTSNGTTTGTLSYGAGLLGTNAFTFNGSSGINLPNGSLDFAGDFSVNMWVKPSVVGPSQLIGSYRNNNVPQTCGWWLALTSGGGLYYSESNGTSTKTLNSSNAIKLNAWSLVTLTRTSTAIKLYVNGSLVGTTTPTFSILYTSTNGFNTIGYQNYGSARFYFNGSIDEVGTWGRELNSTEILGLYNSGIGITHPYSGDSTAALSTYGNYNGALTYGTTFTTGKIGNGYQFNGSSFVDLPAGSLTKTGNFSFSLWVYPTANPSVEKTLISCHDGVKGWMLQYNPSGSLIFYTQSAGGFTLASSTISLNTWTHIAVTIQAGVTAKIYVNGVLGNSISGIANIAYDNYNQYYLPILGAQRYQSPSSVLAEQRSYFTGKIDGINIWDKVINEGEVAQLYNGGLGAEYPFTSQTLISTNDALNITNGIPKNALTYTTGKLGKAFTFDGISSYIQLPTDSLNSLTGDFSLSFWMKANNSNPNSGMIFSNLQVPVGISTYYGWQVSLSSGQIYFTSGSNTGNSTASTRLVSNALSGYIGTWVHVTCTHKQSTGYKIYVNGVLNNSNNGTYNPVYTTNHTPSIGAQYSVNASPNLAYPFNGSLDAVTVWNKELTIDEVNQLYNMGGGIQYPFTVQTIKTPYSVYNGDSLIDPIGGRNATINGGVTYTTGKIGNAYNFNGTDGYLTLPANSMRFAGNFSVSFWVYPTAYPTIAQGQIGIISNASLGYGDGYEVFLYNNGSNSISLFSNFGTANGNSTFPIQLNMTPPPLNTWTLVTITFESNVGVKGYYNGELINSVSSSITTLLYSDMPTTYTPTIGYRTNATGPGVGAKFAGRIDGLTFWNDVLNEPEVLALYNAGSGMEYPYSSSIPSKLPTATDAVGTIHGTATPAMTYVIGKIGRAFKFDGISGYVSLPYNGVPLVKLCIPELGSVLGQYGTYVYPPANSPTVYSVQDHLGVDYSISMWVYLPDVTSGQYLMSTLDRGSTGYQYGWGMVVGSGSIGQYEYYGNGNNNNVNTPITANAWHHVVITRKGPLKNGTNNGTIKIYLNGVLANTTSPSNNHSIRLNSLPAWSSVGVGAWGISFGSPNKSGYVKNGTKIDAITIWEKELSSTEITELYNSGNGKQYPY